MRLDLERSLVEVGGRTFPAVGLVCPEPPSGGESRRDRSLGFSYHRTSRPNDLTWDRWLILDVYVPLESGALVELEYTTRTGTYELHLRARTCEFEVGVPDPLWLPHSLMVDPQHRRIVRYGVPSGGLWEWCDCEGEWVAEYLERLGSYGYVEPPGPRVELVRLRELAALEEDV